MEGIGVVDEEEVSADDVVVTGSFVGGVEI